MHSAPCIELQLSVQQSEEANFNVPSFQNIPTYGVLLFRYSFPGD